MKNRTHGRKENRMDTSIDFSNQMELKHIIDDIDLTEEAPAEEPARQYYFIAKAASYVKKMEAEVGHKLTFFVKTFGCQVNTEHEISKAA